MDLRILRFTISDPATSTELPLANGATLSLAALPRNYEIRARVTSDTKAVRFTLDGAVINDAAWPFTVAGPVTPGSHTLSALPGAGTATGTATSVTFTITAPQPRQLIRGVHGADYQAADGTWHDLDVAKVEARYRELRIESMRLVYTVKDWNAPPPTAKFNLARRYRAAGFKTLGLIRSKVMPSIDQARRYFDSAASAASDALDWWEVLNEPNLELSDLVLAVKRVLVPAYAALHAHGRTVVGFALASIWNDPDTVNLKKCIDAGYLQACDIAAFHKYGWDGHVDGVRNARAIIPQTHRLFLTEWGHHPPAGTSAARWAARFQTTLDGDRPYIDGYWYYRNVMQNAGAGPEGLLTTSFTPHQPFYDAFKAMR